MSNIPCHLLSAAVAVAMLGAPMATVGLRPANAATAASAVSAPLRVGTPNYFWRNCSYLSGRCTPYRLSNPPYNPRVPSIYRTKWVWSWI